ncbi:MAG: ATP-binding protein [Candidatus Cloacimonetes bacterium]|nr:ATP-binding protein [Candidatus Cloacimonadota bacterium]
MLDNDDTNVKTHKQIADTLFEYVRGIIYNTTECSLDFNKLPEEFHNLGKGLNYLQSIVGETKSFAKELSKGNLNCDFPSRGNEIAAPLKTLHASLKHLSWQSQQVAIGDYNQNVNFMGEFSDAFNNMIEQLKMQRKIILDEKSVLKQYVEMILKSTTNPLLVFDSDEKLVYISKSWFRYCDIFDENNVLGKQIDELFEPIVSEDILMDVKYYYMSANAGSKIIETELDTHFNLQENTGHFKLQFTPMIDDEGLVGGMMLFLFDLTESEQARRTAENARELAEQSLRIKTTFLAKMSHEIRTPMNAILGITQLELQKKDLLSETSESFEKIYEASNNLLVLINDILDLSKIETGKMELIPKNYDTPNFIHETIQLNIMQIGLKKIDFYLEIDDSFPKTLYGDDLRLKQILNNILTNAIKYTDKGFIKLSIKTEQFRQLSPILKDIVYSPPSMNSDTASIYDRFTPSDNLNTTEPSIEKDDIYIIFSVEDTGQGIKEEDQKMLFSEYSRFNTQENRDAIGAGLGLSISKKLIELMDGYIDVQSDYGKGSIFTVKVKQKRVDDQCIDNDIIQKLKNQTYKSEKQLDNLQFIQEPMPYGKVLIVDDVETNLYVASKLMSPYHLNIETVLSGFETLDKINEGKVYDIIFMDHMMPQMDGIETTQKLREMGYDGVIVALTANALVGNEEMFKQNGFDDFVSKPIDIRLLNKVLIKYIKDKYAGTIDMTEIANIVPVNNIVSSDAIGINDLDPKLIEIFCRDAKNAADSIRSALINNDIKLFTTNAHAMKSLLATIGETEKSRIAADLEKAGLRQDLQFISENSPSFADYLDALVNRLSPSIKKDNDVSNDDIIEDDNLLKENLQQIIIACQNYDDSAAYKILTFLNEKTWKSDTKECLEKINELLYLHSDFEAAELQAQKLFDKTDTPL